MIYFIFCKFGIGHLLSRLSLERHDEVSASELILLFVFSALWLRASSATTTKR